MGATGYVSTTGDARKVDVAGDTMTGTLILDDGSPAASEDYVAEHGGGGGGGTPSSTVTAETSYGQASSAGVATAYSRGDHTHGTPALPTAAAIGAAATSHAHSGADITSGTVAVGRLPVGSTSSTVAAGDHAHTGVYDPAGTAAAAVTEHEEATDPHGDRAAAAAALAAHEADTTSVHGIADTSALETTTGSTAKVTAHAGATDPHGDRAYADAAVATHAADTTSVHGIADTSALETTTGSAAKVSTHAAATDPHGDRAYTDAAIDTAMLLAGGNLAEVPTNATARGFARVDLDYTANGSTPDALAFYYGGSGGAGGTRTGYFNEYGELRARPALQATVALRCQAHASGSSGDVFQVTSSDNATVYLGVSQTEAELTVPLTAPNLPPVIESGDTLPDPAGYAEGSVFLVVP